MRKPILFAILALTFACKEKPKENVEEVTEETVDVVQEPEWTVLFDGTSFDGWHFYNGGEVMEPWKLEDGAMVLYPPESKPEGANYNLVTDTEFTDFVLSLEWKIAEGGNSGIFWGVKEDEKYGEPYLTGPEIQVLDDERHPDAKNGTDRLAGALYDMVSPSAKAVKPAGEWNAVEIMINHKTNEGHVMLNGTKIVEFPVEGEGWNELVANSKFADWEAFGAFKTGKIGVQDHGDVVAFRNIKIKEL
ncbi:3-keto-disaccharide hydrolase [Flagellimonas beolgyonensis]|uniref:3-keto-disaccharide hydrolase n=1 Tax=Flagellimonas beolgyonensis TaxID=864064 RepID=UPI003D66293D